MAAVATTRANFEFASRIFQRAVLGIRRNDRKQTLRIPLVGFIRAQFALHYLLPELTKVETEAILCHAIWSDKLHWAK
jgi:hypothetical protein